MRFNIHSQLEGRHAFLSASKYHWTRYDDEKLDRVYIAAMAAQRGTELHAFAHEAIRLGIKLPRTQKTLALYVNDAIGFRMVSEQILYYSDNCFGTADTISFRRGILRIHDLKTGVIPTSERQLEVYAALFCLEYRTKPAEIEIELRIYQNDEVRIYNADPDVITHIMDKIISFDKRIEIIKAEAA
jgi:Protein of unknown function (DUF2800)